MVTVMSLDLRTMRRPFWGCSQLSLDHAECGSRHFCRADQPARTIFSV